VDKEYYYKYYKFEREHWWFKARLKILESYIKNNIIIDKASNILNVGAATGATSEMLFKYGRLTSLEYSKDCIEFTKSKLDIQIDWGNILELNFANDSFDLVCSFDVIEHIEDDYQALAELIRTCKKGGSIIFTVPAHMHLWSDHDLVNHHFRRYNSKDINSLVSSFNNVSIEFLSYFNSKLYIPISLFRRIKNYFKNTITERDNIKSDFESFKPGVMNDFLEFVFASESLRISNKIPFSNGVSIVCHLKKI
jgi:SAM-dependent methyltransferase